MFKIVRGNPKGRVYDLDEIGRKIRKEYFWGIERCERISFFWEINPKANMPGLACFTPSENCIYLNSAFDDASVPEYVIEKIIFHELLHVYYRDSGGNPHDEIFREGEKVFKRYTEAEDWLEKNTKKLIGNRLNRIAEMKPKIKIIRKKKGGK